MKKLFTVLCLGLMLAACSQEKTLVSNPEEAIITTDKDNYTKQDLFEGMKMVDYSNVVINSLTDKIAEFEGITKEHLDERVNNALEGIKVVYGDQYPMMTLYYGGEENLKANLYGEAKIQEISNKFFDAHKEDLLNEYKPVMGYVFYTDDAAKASSIIEEVNNGVDMTVAAKNAGYPEEVYRGIYTDKSDIAIEVKEHIAALTELGNAEIVKTVITTSTSNGSIDQERYYVVQILDNNPENYLDDFYATLAKTYDQSAIYSYFFDKYNLEVFDQETYELLSASFEGVK